jgi:CBS domain-containing protein
MKCPSCHSENIEGADECSHCGTPLYGIEQEYTGPDFIKQSVAAMRKRAVHSVKVNDPVSLAIRTMQREDVNCVFVKDATDDIVGILTGWDILQKVAGPNEDLVAVTCDKVMTPNPYILHNEDSVALALNAMASNGLRHLPVSEDGTPTGVITASDLFRYISPHLV